MAENTECGESDLQSAIIHFLRKIEYLGDECIEEFEIEEVSEELNKLMPALSLVLSKWSPEIIYSLYIRKNMGFNEMKKVLRISSRVLSDKLKALEEAGIVVREVRTERPVRVQYELTEKGKTIALALVPLLAVVKRLNQIEQSTDSLV